ncbi:MAG: hypothetical protein A3D41_04865 [Candidatus Sungbacteria bacterium RIFCSPHIGHO2_02_FULL_41_12b]|nr:MAG: hypothetical protein A3D41_04865 [Candidatus Sungbacteria bacterium RIFCSPHIGHO2_02_FULL_41_12b]
MEQSTTTTQILNVVIRDRSGILFEGEADSVSSYNDTGDFDVMPFHANFISIIKNNIVLRLKGGRVQTIPLKTGIIKVSQNKVEVYLGIVH